MHHLNLSDKKGVAGPPTHVFLIRLSHSGLDCRDLELQLQHWRNLRPKPPSRSRAIRVLLRRALAAEKQREDGSSDENKEAQT
jgi:hypothetical protein